LKKVAKDKIQYKIGRKNRAAKAIVITDVATNLFFNLCSKCNVSELVAIVNKTDTKIAFKNGLKSSIMTITLTSIFFVPIVYCIFSFINFFNQMDQQSLIHILDQMKIFLQNVSKELPFLKTSLNDITSKIDVAKTVENIFSVSAYLGKNSAQFIIDIVMILIFFFFFTLYSSSIAKFIEMINNNYPDKIVDDKQTEYLYKGFEIEGVSHNFNPAEKEIKSFSFETEDEAKFVNQMWKLCKYEININHFQHLIPIVFRMLKLFKSKWSDSITTQK
jgi:hypothetical protein